MQASYILDTLSPLQLKEPSTSPCSRWKGKTLSILLTGFAVAGRSLDSSAWGHAICDLSIGFGLQMCADQFIGDRYLVAHKIGLTMLGQLPMFLMTLAYDNVEGFWKPVISSAIVGMLGAHIAMYANQFF